MKIFLACWYENENPSSSIAYKWMGTICPAGTLVRSSGTSGPKTGNWDQICPFGAVQAQGGYCFLLIKQSFLQIQMWSKENYINTACRPIKIHQMLACLSGLPQRLRRDFEGAQNGKLWLSWSWSSQRKLPARCYNEGDFLAAHCWRLEMAARHALVDDAVLLDHQCHDVDGGDDDAIHKTCTSFLCL